MHGDYPTRLVCTGMHTGDEDWSLLMVALIDETINHELRRDMVKRCKGRVQFQFR